MTTVLNGHVNAGEISDRIDRLQARYAGNPLVKEIKYRIGADWSDDPSIFIEVAVERDVAQADLLDLAQNMRVDLLRLVRSDEIGLHSYLNFVN